MFFIVNHENSIIAADADFLEGIGVESIYDAALLIKNGEVVLDELEQSISYFQQSKGFAKVKLSTFLGDAYLYEINKEIEETEEEIEKEGETTASVPEEDALFNLAMPQAASFHKEEIHKEEPETISEPEAENEEIFALTDKKEELKEEEPLDFAEPDESIDDFLQIDISDIPRVDLEDTDKTAVSEEHTKEESTEGTSEEILGLIETDMDTIKTELEAEVPEGGLDLHGTPPLSPESPEEPAAEEEKALSIMEEPATFPDSEIEPADREDLPEVPETFESIAEIPVKTSQTNFQEIAELIGVSEEEYLHFLDDFVKESSQLEANLRSNDLRESREALSILKEASLLLHLPQVTEKLNELSNATSDEKSSIIDSYLAMVTQIRSGAPVQSSAEEVPLVSLAEQTIEEDETVVSLTGTDEGENQEADTIAESVQHLADQASVSLDQVQAIPFDFSINEAADELTLPASLVSEFVVDFINQAKENLPVLQKAYEQKDLETIQTTAHMLKGASSNLRIVPIAETLYRLQFNEDITQVPELITLFSGQLKALSIQMDQA